jgi:hypothetical protein
VNVAILVSPFGRSVCRGGHIHRSAREHKQVNSRVCW